MIDRPVTWLDVFTTEPLTGNGLAVVHDADRLDDATMLAFARETRLSETTFVQIASRPEADYRNRIFTTAGELPFAGHPSLGTAIAVARLAGLEQARYVQETQAGLQPIEVEIAGNRAQASMLQEPAVHGEELDQEAVLRTVGLDPQDAHPDLPPQIVSTGLPNLMVPVRDDAIVARAWPSHDAIAGLLGPHGAVVLYLASIDADAGTAHARGFTDSVVLGEDPATGSAAGPLMAYAAQRLGLRRLTVTQGVEMGRRSVLRCSLDGDRPRVGGDAVVLMDGTVRLDT